MENKENKIKLTYGTKKKICNAVENNSIIWKKADKLHFNRSARKKAWEMVSKEVGISCTIMKNNLKFFGH